MLGSWGVTGPTGATAPTGPGSGLPEVWVGLWTAPLADDDDGTATGEVPIGGGSEYGRVKVDNNSTNWLNATGGTTAVKTNGTAIVFPQAGTLWGTITHFALLDAETGGNILFWGELTSAKEIGEGDTASFSAGALTITED